MKKLHPPIEYQRLIELARTNNDPVVQELLWEIKRLHRILADDLRDIDVIRDAWAHEVGGSLAAIHMMRSRLRSEPAAFEWDRTTTASPQSNQPFPGNTPGAVD